MTKHKSSFRDYEQNGVSTVNPVTAIAEHDYFIKDTTEIQSEGNGSGVDEDGGSDNDDDDDDDDESDNDNDLNREKNLLLKKNKTTKNRSTSVSEVIQACSDVKLTESATMNKVFENNNNISSERYFNVKLYDWSWIDLNFYNMRENKNYCNMTRCNEQQFTSEIFRAIKLLKYNMEVLTRINMLQCKLKRDCDFDESTANFCRVNKRNDCSYECQRILDMYNICVCENITVDATVDNSSLLLYQIYG